MYWIIPYLLRYINHLHHYHHLPTTSLHLQIVKGLNMAFLKKWIMYKGEQRWKHSSHSKPMRTTSVPALKCGLFPQGCLALGSRVSSWTCFGASGQSGSWRENNFISQEGVRESVTENIILELRHEGKREIGQINKKGTSMMSRGEHACKGMESWEQTAGLRTSKPTQGTWKETSYKSGKSRQWCALKFQFFSVADRSHLPT